MLTEIEIREGLVLGTIVSVYKEALAALMHRYKEQEKVIAECALAGCAKCSEYTKEAETYKNNVPPDLES